MSGWKYLATFAASFIAVAILTPLARNLALRYNITDNPDGPGGRKTQRVPVPYLGGLAMALGMTFAVLLGTFLSNPHSGDVALALSVMGPALMLALIGFLDDKSGLGVRSRLLSQIIAGTIIASLLISSGTQASIFGYWWIDGPVTIFWVVGIVNAMNFMDNMDGLSASVGGIAGLAFAALAASNGQFLVAALSLALAGACGGFLIFNWSPARIYMGDAGAHFIGCILAVIAIRLNLLGVSQPASLMAKLLVLALPILDTTTVVISRLRRGVSPLTGGRDHLSHRIAARLENQSRSGEAVTRLTVGALVGIAIVGGIISISIAG